MNTFFFVSPRVNFKDSQWWITVICNLFLFNVASLVLAIQHYHCCAGNHDDAIKWKQFPRHWPFVRGIHRSGVNSPLKGQWRGALMYSLICAGINDWVNNHEAGDLRRHRPHYDVTVMGCNVLDDIWTVHTVAILPYINSTIGVSQKMLIIRWGSVQPLLKSSPKRNRFHYWINALNKRPLSLECTYSILSCLPVQLEVMLLSYEYFI